MMPLHQTCPRTLEDSFPVVFSTKNAKPATNKKSVAISGTVMWRKSRHLKELTAYADERVNMKLMLKRCVRRMTRWWVGGKTYLRQF